MFEGRELLRRIKSVTGEVSGSYAYNNMIIKGPSLDRGIAMYQTGINKFLGNSLIKRLEKIQFKTIKELQKKLEPDKSYGNGEWVDLAGLIAPQTVVNKLLDDIESGKIKSLQHIEEEFRDMHKSYYYWEWIWSCERIEGEAGKPINKFTAADVIAMVEKWKKSVIDLDKMLYEDARKEFTLSSMTGFGIDGGEDIKRLDFEQVRGDFESNSVVASIQDHIREKTTLGDELIMRVSRIK
jgi:hypothetical protein